MITVAFDIKGGTDLGHRQHKVLPQIQIWDKVMHVAVEHALCITAECTDGGLVGVNNLPQHIDRHNRALGIFKNILYLSPITDQSLPIAFQAVPHREKTLTQQAQLILTVRINLKIKVAFCQL